MTRETTDIQTTKHLALPQDLAFHLLIQIWPLLVEASKFEV